MRQRTPMGRGGEEHELDGALLFLASDAEQLRDRPGPLRRRRLDRDLTLLRGMGVDASVAELADAPGLGPGLQGVGVRVSPLAPRQRRSSS